MLDSNQHQRFWRPSCYPVAPMPYARTVTPMKHDHPHQVAVTEASAAFISRQANTSGRRLPSGVVLLPQRGMRRIRTSGTSQCDCFRDSCIKPLCQHSKPDLVNVQVVRTFGMVDWLLPPTARNVYVYMHPFGRASPSVINRLIKAGSLLSPTCSSGDIRAIPSVTQAATPMKPRANLGNRTRQPKGCANRIADQPKIIGTSPYRPRPG